VFVLEISLSVVIVTGSPAKRTKRKRYVSRARGGQPPSTSFRGRDPHFTGTEGSLGENDEGRFLKVGQKVEIGGSGRAPSHFRGGFDPQSGTRVAKRGFRGGIVSRESGVKGGIFGGFWQFFAKKLNTDTCTCGKCRCDTDAADLRG
jgi:hypothetical protein